MFLSEPTGDFEILANVQEHWSMEGRAIVREANVDEYATDPAFATHMELQNHTRLPCGVKINQNPRGKATSTPRGNSAYAPRSYIREIRCVWNSSMGYDYRLKSVHRLRLHVWWLVKAKTTFLLSVRIKFFVGGKCTGFV